MSVFMYLFWDLIWDLAWGLRLFLESVFILRSVFNFGSCPESVFLLEYNLGSVIILQSGLESEFNLSVYKGIPMAPGGPH